VCFTKHLWEHSVYWETFDGVKNQERVLSIQAAIILSNPFLEFLLVTSPSSQEKKKEDINKASENSKQQQSKKKRKRPYVAFSKVQD
jgi:predicted SAM-dependent methyltransferase